MEIVTGQLRNQLLYLFGTHLVCAELAKHGIVPIVTSRNTRGVDVLAMSKDGRQSATIQVKTGRKRSRDWPIGEIDFENKTKQPYFVFVCLAGAEFRGGAEFYIVPNNMVVRRTRGYLEWKKKHPGKKECQASV